MKATISLITRGRPDLLIPTVEKTLANIQDPQTTLMVAVDDDDTATLKALNGWNFAGKPWFSIAPREDTLGAKWNRALTIAPADLYIIMVDYAPHLTPGFDRMYLDAAALFPDGIGIVQNRLANNLTFSACQGITAGLAARMNFIYPPFFSYWFVDHFADDIASMIGRRAFADCAVDNSKRPGTRELREPGFWASVYDALEPMRRQCATDIIRSDDFQEPEWRKRLLLDAFPLVCDRSRMINENLRQNNDIMERQSGAGPGDARYLRTKQAAIDLVRRFTEGEKAA